MQEQRMKVNLECDCWSEFLVEYSFLSNQDLELCLALHRSSISE